MKRKEEVANHWDIIPVRLPKEEEKQATKDESKRKSIQGAEKVAQRGTQQMTTIRRRMPSTDSYLSHWQDGIPIVKQEETSHKFQFGQDLFTGDNAPMRNPSAQPGGQKDLLTGEPILENMPGTPILQTLSSPPILQTLSSPPILQNLSSTPLQPTSASISEGPNLTQRPPNVGSFIDEIRVMEANRNMRIAELMARDEDFETQIGFDDRYTLVPSSSGNDTSNEEEEVDNEVQTTITELLLEKTKHQNEQATPTLPESEKSQDAITSKESPPVQDKEKSETERSQVAIASKESPPFRKRKHLRQRSPKVQ